MKSIIMNIYNREEVFSTESDGRLSSLALLTLVTRNNKLHDKNKSYLKRQHLELNLVTIL